MKPAEERAEVLAKRARDNRLVTVSVDVAPKTTAKPLPWIPVTLAAAALVAVAGWLLIAGAAVAGWLAAPDESLGDALRLGTQLWALTNGAAITLGGLQLSLVPLGMTTVVVLLATGAAAFAASNAELGEHPNRFWSLVGSFTATYAVCVAAPTFLLGQQAGLARALVGSVLISGGSAWFAAIRASGKDVTQAWPVWARSVPKAALAALLTVLAGAGAALAAGLLIAKDRMIALHEALEPGIVGGFVLLVISLAYLPNLLAWMASWVLGAGFSVGAGTVVSPSQVDVGLLPSLPVFAAIEPGPGSWASLWWLLTGVAAGALAGVTVVRARDRARIDETALVGGLAGVTAGVLVVALAWLSNGSFGTQRLSFLGARVGVLIVLAPTLLGLSGLAAGLIFGLVRKAEVLAPDQADQLTTVIRDDSGDTDLAEPSEAPAVVEREPTAVAPDIEDEPTTAFGALTPVDTPKQDQRAETP